MQGKYLLGIPGTYVKYLFGRDQFYRFVPVSIKGKRLAGRMGNARVKLTNLQVVKILPEQNLIVISGSVPGAKNSTVILQK